MSLNDNDVLLVISISLRRIVIKLSEVQSISHLKLNHSDLKYN